MVGFLSRMGNLLLKGRLFFINIADHKRTGRESLKRRLQTRAWASKMLSEVTESKQTFMGVLSPLYFKENVTILLQWEFDLCVTLQLFRILFCLASIYSCR